jgi:hypothetical protein
MLRRLVFGIATSLVAAAAAPSPGVTLEAPSAYQISGPVAHDNLSVYFVRGQGTNAPVPLTLDEAVASGSAKIHVRQDGSGTHLIDNLSTSAIFVPAGALLVGDLQDQVVATSTIVPPGASNVLLSVFCVEKGRSSARVGDDPSAFRIGDALLPSHMAKLILLSGSGGDANLRQVGVWLSARSVVEGLSHRLGGSVASPRSASSLPLALEDARVAEAQSGYVEALGWPVTSGDVIGAVFAVNGRVSSAEIFSSNELFRKMWPQLLRGYATQAMVEESLGSGPAPSTESVMAFLSGAEQGEVQDARLPAQDKFQDGLEKRVSDAALYSVLSEGSFVQRSYLARTDGTELTTTREGTVLQMLQAGLFEQYSAPVFRPYTWDGFFQLVDEYQQQLRTLGSADPTRPIQPALVDYQHALLLASLNVERRNIDIRSPFTGGPIFTGGNRGDNGPHALFKVGLPILMGLLAFFAASRHRRAPARALRPARRYRSFALEPRRRRAVAVAQRSAVLSPEWQPTDLRLAPTDRAAGPVLPDEAPAGGVMELLRGWARLGSYALRQTGHVLRDALRDLIARRIWPIGLAVRASLRRPGCGAALV